MNWKTAFHLKNDPFSNFLVYCENHKGVFCSKDVGARIIVDAIKNKNIEIVDNIEEIRLHDVECIYTDECVSKEITGNIRRYSGDKKCWRCKRSEICDKLFAEKCYDFESIDDEILIVAH